MTVPDTFTGPGRDTTPPGYTPVLGGPAPAVRTASASSAHNMLKAVGIELAFVVVATMLAGMSGPWGNGMLALMLALLVLRGLFEIDLFAAFAQGTTLHP